MSPIGRSAQRPKKTGATHRFPIFGFDKPSGMLFGDDNGQGARVASNWRKKKASFCLPSLASFWQNNAVSCPTAQWETYQPLCVPQISSALLTGRNGLH